jgi:S-adenosylmethionine synthetase
VDEIHVQEISGVTASESEVEIVERKGLGHPDTICDLVMEQISQQLSRAYTASSGASFIIIAIKASWSPAKWNVVSAVAG